jgi:hypothetical protein
VPVEQIRGPQLVMAAEVVNNDVIMNEILTRIQKINVVYDAELLKLQNGLSNVFNDIAKERRHLVAEFERDREFERAYQLAEYRAAQTENDRNMLLINRAQNAEQRTALVDAHRAAQPASTYLFAFCQFSARCV